MVTLSCAVDAYPSWRSTTSRFLLKNDQIFVPMRLHCSLASTEDLSQVYQSTESINRAIFMLPSCTVCDSLIPITGIGSLSEAPENLHLRPPPRIKLVTKAPRLAGNPRNFSSSRHLISYLSGNNDQQRSLSLHCPHFPS